MMEVDTENDETDFRIARKFSLLNPILRNKVRERLQHPMVKNMLLLQNAPLDQLRHSLDKNGIDIILNQCLPKYSSLIRLYKTNRNNSIPYDFPNRFRMISLRNIQSHQCFEKLIRQKTFCKLHVDDLNSINKLYLKAHNSQQKNKYLIQYIQKNMAEQDFIDYNSKKQEKSKKSPMHFVKTSKLDNVPLYTILKQLNYKNPINYQLGNRIMKKHEFQGYVSDLDQKFNLTIDNIDLTKETQKSSLFPSLFYEHKLFQSSLVKSTRSASLPIKYNQIPTSTLKDKVKDTKHSQLCSDGAIELSANTLNMACQYTAETQSLFDMINEIF